CSSQARSRFTDMLRFQGFDHAPPFGKGLRIARQRRQLHLGRFTNEAPVAAASTVTDLNKRLSLNAPASQLILAPSSHSFLPTRRRSMPPATISLSLDWGPHRVRLCEGNRLPGPPQRFEAEAYNMCQMC